MVNFFQDYTLNYQKANEAIDASKIIIDDVDNDEENAQKEPRDIVDLASSSRTARGLPNVDEQVLVNESGGENDETIDKAISQLY